MNGKMLQRLLPTGEHQHLRAAAAARIAGGVALTVCGGLTLTFGGHDAKTYRWAAAFLSLAAASYAAGVWEWASAGSEVTRGQ